MTQLYYFFNDTFLAFFPVNHPPLSFYNKSLK